MSIPLRCRSQPQDVTSTGELRHLNVKVTGGVKGGEDFGDAGVGALQR